MNLLVLNATTKTLEIELDDYSAVSEVDFTSHYADATASGFIEGENDGTSNGNTPVTVVAAPAASTRRIVREITLYNDDIVSVIVRLQLNNNGTIRIIKDIDLDPGGFWSLSQDGSVSGGGTWDGDITDIDETSSADIGEALADDDEVIVYNTSGTAFVWSAISRLWTYISGKVNAANGVAITGLDIDGGTDIGADLADADLIIVDDGAGGTNRKSAISRIWTYIQSKISGGAVTAAAGDVDLSGIDDGYVLTQDGSGNAAFEPASGGGVWGSITGTLSDQIDLNPPDAHMWNGKIVPSVASNNLTVALKGLDGNDPSAGNPVYVRIGDTVRAITSALSVTKNAGTNWFNAGSSGLATKEIDYFVYLGYNATDGVVIGFSRIPDGREYDSFSATTTDEKYCAISTITNAAAGDDYVNIGRFAATLSAGAGYTWSVPTFTNKNLIQHPIFETRWLSWQPTYSGNGSMTYTSVSTTIAKYKVRPQVCEIQMICSGTVGGTPNTNLTITLPFEAINAPTNPIVVGGLLFADSGTAVGFGGGYISNASPDIINAIKYNAANWASGAGAIANIGSGRYEI